MLDSGQLLVMLVFAVAPATLVLVVALLRGYTILFEPRSKRRRDDA